MHTRFAQLTIAGGFVASIGLVAPSFTARPAAQEPAAQAPDAQTPGDRPTFRGGTRLATFDAVVTDDKGRHVTGLTPDDFEVVERGKRQTVRHVVYVNVAGTEAASGSPGIAMPGRPGALRENTGRVLAIVIDDLRMSFPSIVYTRHVLNEYLDRHFRPGDVVAIIRTLGGGGTLQQFTTDRRLLKAAIERIRWSPREWPSFDPGGPVGYGPRPAERLEREFTLDGSLGALEYVVRGVQALPGRKTVVFVSHGFSLDGPGWYGSGIRSDVERVIDTANRGGVVLYTLDPTGLRSASLTAADGPFAASRRSSGLGDVGESSVAMAQSLAAATQVRLRANQEQQYSLEYLARETGGFAVVGNNNLTGGLARIMRAARGRGGPPPRGSRRRCSRACARESDPDPALGASERAVLRHAKCRPPSTRMVSPVTKSVSQRNSTACAIASSPPQRPSGVAAATSATSASLRSGGATIGPGAIAFTRIWSLATSSARASVSATTPALAT